MPLTLITIPTSVSKLNVDMHHFHDTIVQVGYDHNITWQCLHSSYNYYMAVLYIGFRSNINSDISSIKQLIKSASYKVCYISCIKKYIYII